MRKKFGCEGLNSVLGWYHGEGEWRQTKTWKDSLPKAATWTIAHQPPAWSPEIPWSSLDPENDFSGEATIAGGCRILCRASFAATVSEISGQENR